MSINDTSINSVEGKGGRGVGGGGRIRPGLSRRASSASLGDVGSLCESRRTCTVLFPTWRPVELTLAPGIAF